MLDPSRLLTASVIVLMTILVPVAGAQGVVISSWFDAEGRRWDDGVWTSGVPNGAGDAATIRFADGPPGRFDAARIEVPQPLVLAALSLEARNRFFEFGAFGQTLTFERVSGSGQNLLSLYGSGARILTGIVAGNLGIQARTSAHFGSGIQSSGRLEIRAADSLSVAGGVSAESMLLELDSGFSGPGPQKTVVSGALSSRFDLTIRSQGFGPEGDSVVVNDAVSAGKITLRNQGDATSLLRIAGPVSAENSVEFDAGRGVLKVDQVLRGKVTASGRVGSLIEVGLGREAGKVGFFQDGSVRINAVDSGYSGELFGRVGEVFDVAADLTLQRIENLEVGTMRLSVGGKVDVRALAGDGPTVELAGGELRVPVSGSIEGLAMEATRGQSVINFADPSGAPELSADSLGVASGSLVVVRRDGRAGDPVIRLKESTPEMSGSGALKTDSVGIVKGVVFDSTASAGAGFATYDATAETMRALTESEYRNAVGAGANVKLSAGLVTAGDGIGVNSLVLDGGADLRFPGAEFGIASGMVVSTGVEPNVIGFGAGGGQRIVGAGGAVQFFTGTDLTLNVGVDGTLVKSGDARLILEPGGSATTGVVVNRGTLDVKGGQQFGEVTVRSGGKLRSDSSVILDDLGTTRIEAGGRWELDGYEQALTGLSGRGTVVGVNEWRAARFEYDPNPTGAGPNEPVELGIEFAGNLDLVIGSGAPIALTGQSTHTGETLILGEVRLGADNALSPHSALRVAPTLHLDGYRATAAGLRVGGFGVIDGGDGATRGELTLVLADGVIETARGLRIEGGTRIVKRGAGTQTLVDSNLLDAHGGAEFEVQAGTLVIDEGQWGGRGQVRIGNGGTLEVRTVPDGFVEVVDVAGGAVVRRDSHIFEGEAAHRYRQEAGSRTEFELLRMEGFEVYEAGFSEAGGGDTISDVIELNSIADFQFVLQIGFDAVALADSLSDLRVGWFDGGEWIEAVLGNSAGEGRFVGRGAWDGEFELGEWGLDADAGRIWAVLDYGGEFSVIAVPEAGTWGLVVMGLAGLLVVRVWRGGARAGGSRGGAAAP